MELEVLDKSGKGTGKKVKLNDAVFGVEPSEHAIYLDIKQYLANQRQGNHSSLERSDVKGSTRKIKKQKGTGTARAGSVKNPLFRGGGTMFGPQPRNYGFKLNKKLKVVARKSAFSKQLKENQLVVLEDLNYESPKTKDFVATLSALQTDGKRVTVVLNDHNKNVYLSSRNIPKVKLVTVNDLNTYDLLNCQKLVITESSVKTIEEKLS
jgi:large subunit ribosomal protein L4